MGFMLISMVIGGVWMLASVPAALKGQWVGFAIACVMAILFTMMTCSIAIISTIKENRK